MERLDGDDAVQMSFEVSGVDDGTASVSIRGDLDISNVERLEAAAAPVLDRRPNRLVVDVSELRFADSSAIAVWVRWAAAVDKLELRDPSPLLRQVITRMGLSGKLQLR